ncbi:TnsA endonuclease N-terminal domain-containing protein [Dickeya chrysanthemi]|uniref:TnsA endonuclease N-terminal domain-containing protein n=1 Tax=Dickeya chrysanthemi TaxID=556 RepID=UPI001EE665CA|nr:TnsA endonuclease N-terminal domain-containing protein [Dickeya chrysanthemi]WJM85723.1 TnsA endonuclease N-terminal domain-containing protein [Dickeya chrysanthemi]
MATAIANGQGPILSSRSHRVFGHKSQRTHHLLSDLELAVFLLLEWNRSTQDIRGQFPLRLEDTKALALESGISHPSVRGVLQVMSSDFLVNTTDTSQPKFALQAKYAKALEPLKNWSWNAATGYKKVFSGG